jgi:hypothetical protein
MKKAVLCILAVGLASSGFAITYAKDRKPAAGVSVVGAAKSCVPIRSIRSTAVVDDSTIDFKMVGGKTLRNHLPLSCPGLKFQDSFSYRTSLSQLCNVDVIRVVQNYGGGLQEGAACGLGKFQPVEVVKPAI